MVLAHLDELPVELRAAVAEIMDASGAWFVATTVTAVSSDAPSGLDDRFAAVVHRSPLRERPTEFVGIVSNLLAQIGVGGASLRCDPHVLAVLSKQRWPGNISQLRRVLASAAISATNGEIALVDVPVTALLDAQARGLGRLERLEREEILASLAESAWNREAAAKALGISRATMYRKLKQFNISVPSSRD